MIPVAKPFLNKDDAQAAYDTILTHWVTQGPKVHEFEQKFAEYVGSKFAVAVSNCTAALHLSLLTVDVGPGDEVICPSLSFIATANCIKYVGATPVFGEVENSSYNLDPEHVEKLITKRTKAIIIVHQIGLPANIDRFIEICKQNKLILIEDAACAIGSNYKGKKIGTHSDLVCFSFHPRKILTTGDGGMITTSNEKVRDKLLLLRQHGMSINDLDRHKSEKIIFENYIMVGYNYRMTDIQASVGITQLKRLDYIVKERNKIASYYIQNLKDINCIQLPFVPIDVKTNFQSFMICVKKNSPITRDELIEKLLAKGISTRRGVMSAHLEPAYYEEYQDVELKVSEYISKNGIILPLFVPMSKIDMEMVVSTIRTLLS